MRARSKTKRSLVRKSDAIKSHAAIADQSPDTRKALVKQFIESVVLSQYRQLVDWQTVTGQSSQLDSGYLGQQLVSLLTGIPGVGRRGKGADLLDGSEVKAASTLSGIDVPRWNNQIGRAQNRLRYLEKHAIFFVLFDTVTRAETFPLRVRVWRVSPRSDRDFRAVIETWGRRKSSGNFQLHPPCWDAGNVATNQAGNLKLPLMFQAQQKEIGKIDFMEINVIKPKPGKCRRV